MTAYRPEPRNLSGLYSWPLTFLWVTISTHNCSKEVLWDPLKSILWFPASTLQSPTLYTHIGSTERLMWIASMALKGKRSWREGYGLINRSIDVLYLFISNRLDLFTFVLLFDTHYSWWAIRYLHFITEIESEAKWHPVGPTASIKHPK